MSTIKLINKLNNLGILIEVYKGKISGEYVHILPSNCSIHSYVKLFREEVLKAALMLIEAEREECTPSSCGEALLMGAIQANEEIRQ
jgi:hypothetical protein